MKWQKELELAKTAAKTAGNLLRELQRKPAHILNADGRDLKLHADRESEKVIIQGLKAASSYMILAEESGEHGSLDSDTAMWIVDPLDGTINFSRGMSLSCVSIALWRQNHPVLGVVYDFNRDELFSGIVGEGAWCNDETVVVSNVTNTNKAILTTGFPVNRDFESASIRDFLNSIQEFKKIRLLGSAALSLAYVACGRVDAYTEEDIMLWDVAAGIALVMAAGGWVEIKNSSRKKWARHVRCAANAEIFHKNLVNPAYIYKRRDQIVPYFQGHASRLARNAQKYLAAHGLPVTANDRKLFSLKNKYKGRRCFVIGNGPSLQISDLEKLKDEITIASNKIYLAFPDTEWRPTYYTISDIVVAENNRKSIIRLPFDKYVTRRAKHLFGRDPGFVYYDMATGEGGEEPETYNPKFSKDITQFIAGGFSVTLVNLQLAYYFGVREVYLIGTDFSFTVPQRTRPNSSYGKVLVSDGEVNHFLPNYRQTGETWTRPRLDLQLVAFEKARLEFEAVGGKILNASRSTKLDVFPKVAFDSLAGF